MGMSDLTRKDPQTEPTTEGAVSPTVNPPIRVEVWFDEANKEFHYSNGNGNVVIHRRLTDPRKFTIYLDRKDGEAWDFVEGGFRWNAVGTAKPTTPDGKDVLTAESYAANRITIQDLVEYKGPDHYKYKFKIKLYSTNKIEETPDPEIQNNKEIQAAHTVTDH